MFQLYQTLVVLIHACVFCKTHHKRISKNQSVIIELTRFQEGPKYYSFDHTCEQAVSVVYLKTPKGITPCTFPKFPSRYCRIFILVQERWQLCSTRVSCVNISTMPCK